jgi:hypothetical protein
VDGGVSIYITPLSLPHSCASEARGKFGQTASQGRRSGNRPNNWRERIQIKKGETPWLASAGNTVPADALSCFPGICSNDLSFNRSTVRRSIASVTQWCNDLKFNDLSFNDLRCNDLPLKRSTRFSTAARLSLRNDAPHIPRFGAALGCAQDWEFLNDED